MGQPVGQQCLGPDACICIDNLFRQILGGNPCVNLLTTLAGSYGAQLRAEGSGKGGVYTKLKLPIMAILVARSTEAEYPAPRCAELLACGGMGFCTVST